MGEMNVTIQNCQFCGGSHGLRCPEVKAVEYDAEGKVKRVEYLTPADRYFPMQTWPSTVPAPSYPSYPYVGDPVVSSGHHFIPQFSFTAGQVQ
jgi:hypothetical protein